MSWGQRSTDGQFTRLCDSIRENTTQSDSLTMLHAKYSSTWSSAHALKLFSALKRNRSLRELVLAGLPLDRDACEAFREVLAANKDLRVLSIGSQDLGDELCEVLFEGIARSALREVDLENRSLRGVTCKFDVVLHTLNLAQNKLGDEGAIMLARGLEGGGCLMALDLSFNDIKTKGIEALCGRLVGIDRKLSKLDFSGNENMGSFGFAALAPVSCEELILDGCRGGDSGCTALALGKPRRILSISENDLTCVGVEALGEFLFLSGQGSLEVELRVLRLSRNYRVGNAGVEALARVLEMRREIWPTMSGLELLDLSQIGATCLPSVIVSGVARAVLYVGNSPLDQNHVVQSLTHDTSATIVSLSLSGTDIPDLVPIFTSLRDHPSLTIVEFGGIGMSEQAHEALEELRLLKPTLDIAVDKAVDDSTNNDVAHGASTPQA